MVFSGMVHSGAHAKNGMEQTPDHAAPRQSGPEPKPPPYLEGTE